MSGGKVIDRVEDAVSEVLSHITHASKIDESFIRAEVQHLARDLLSNSQGGFAASVALALDLDADADSDAILSTLQRRLNAPAIPAYHETLSHGQLVKVCQYLTEHRQGDPAVTFHNAPDLVSTLIGDLEGYTRVHYAAQMAVANRDDQLKPCAVDADALGAVVVQLRESGLELRDTPDSELIPVNADTVTKYVSWLLSKVHSNGKVIDRLKEAEKSREQEDKALNAAVGLLADSLGRPQGVTLYGLIEQAAKEISYSRSRVQEASVPVSQLRHLIASQVEKYKLAVFEDGAPDSIFTALRVMAEQLASLNENKLRDLIERANGGRVDNVWPALEETITELLANQKPIGFDEAALQMIQQQQQADEALAAIGNILKLTGRG